MKLITLGKALCVLVLLLCVSMISYAELIMNHGVVYQQLESQNDPLSTFAEMPLIRHIPEYLENRRIARFSFNTNIEEIMLRARIQKRVVNTAA